MVFLVQSIYYVQNYFIYLYHQWKYQNHKKKKIDYIRFYDNVPLIIIEILTIFYYDDNIHYVSYIALCWSLFSFIIGLYTFISKLSIYCNNKDNQNNKVLYKLTIKSSKITKYHIYTHKLLTKCLSYNLEISTEKIEILTILPIIGCIISHIQIFVNNNNDKKINQINKSQTEICTNLKMLSIYYIVIIKKFIY